MDLKVLDDVPQFDGTETERERVDKIAEYLYRLAEALKYALTLLYELDESGEGGK